MSSYYEYSMRNKPNKATKGDVTEGNSGEMLRLKDNPSRDDLRKAKSPVSILVGRFQ